MFSASGLTAYITWAGTYNKTVLNHQPWNGPYYDYEDAGVFFAVGTSTGSSWTVTFIAGAISQDDGDDFWNPSMGIWNGTIYLIYTQSNETYCDLYEYGATCSPLDGTFVQWVETSTNGIAWSSANLVSIGNTCVNGYCETYEADESFAGYNSAVGFTTTGKPLLVYALPEADSDVYNYIENYNATCSCYTFYEWINYTTPTELEIAMPYSGPTVSVNFTESGLAAGTSWTVNLNGAVYQTTDTWLNVTNVPQNTQVIITSPAPVNVSYGTLLEATTSVSGGVSFSTNATVWVNYTLAYLFQLTIQPSSAEAFVYWDYPANEESYVEQGYECFPCRPYYYDYYYDGQSYPNGTVLWLIDGDGGISYWTGTGAGNFTGTPPTRT